MATRSAWASARAVEDVTRVLARYHRVVGARVFDHAVLEEMAAVDAVPIVNLLSDLAHPCQALADLLTLRQRWGALAGRTVAWVGDGNNVARSLTLACGLSGIDVRLACPPGHELDPVAVDGARAHGVDGRRHRRTRGGGRRAPTPSAPTCGSPWARRPNSASAQTPSPATGRRGPDGAGPRPTPSSCTACRPTAAWR